MFNSLYHKSEDNRTSRPKVAAPFKYYVEAGAQNGAFKVRYMDEDGQPQKDSAKELDMIVLDILFAVRKKEVKGADTFSQYFRRFDEPVLFFNRPVGSEKTGVMFGGNPTSYSEGKGEIKAANGRLNLLLCGVMRKTGTPVLLQLNGFSYADFGDQVKSGGVDFRETPVLRLSYIGGRTVPNPAFPEDVLYFPDLSVEPMTAQDSKNVDETTAIEIREYIAYKRPEGADTPQAQPKEEAAPVEPENPHTEDEAPGGFPLADEDGIEEDYAEDLPL